VNVLIIRSHFEITFKPKHNDFHFLLPEVLVSEKQGSRNMGRKKKSKVKLNLIANVGISSTHLLKQQLKFLLTTHTRYLKRGDGLLNRSTYVMFLQAKGESAVENAPRDSDSSSAGVSSQYNKEDTKSFETDIFTCDISPIYGR